MNTKLRKEYTVLQEILVKLYSLLDEAKEKNNSENSVQVILESIESVKKDEAKLIRQIKNNIYKNYTKKEIDDYCKELERKNIEREKQIRNMEIEKNNKEFLDAKVIFDGVYKLVYSNGTKVITKRLDKQLLDKNSDFAFDYNICDFLRTIDDEKGTNLYKKYRYGELTVIYDFNSCKKLDRKSLKQIKKLSKETSERNENVSVNKFKRRTLKGVLTTASIAAMVGLSTLGITNLFRKSNKSDVTQNTYSVSNEINTNDIEKSIEEETKNVVNNAIISDTDNHIVRVQDNVKLKVNEDLIVKETENTVVKVQDNVKTKVNEKNKDEEENNNNEFYGLQIGSTMELPDMDLYYSSTATQAVGNAKYLRAHTGIYKIDLISIVYKGRCLEVIKNQGDNLDLLKEYVKETYGDDVKISVNLDVVNEEGKTIYKNVGWVDSDIFYKKSNVKSLVMNK